MRKYSNRSALLIVVNDVVVTFSVFIDLQVVEREKGALVHSASIQSTDSSSGTDTKRTVHFEEVRRKCDFNLVKF